MPALVLIELNGADPVHVASTDPAVETLIIDWDEVREGSYTPAELRTYANRLDALSPNTAHDLRAVADGAHM